MEEKNELKDQLQIKLYGPKGELKSRRGSKSKLEKLFDFLWSLI